MGHIFIFSMKAVFTTVLCLVACTEAASFFTKIAARDNDPTGRDFACGVEVGALCGGLPRDEIRECLRRNRDKPSHECHEKFIEQESFECGLEAERLCGAARKNGTEAFRKCIKDHKEVFQRICPESAHDAPKWDKEANIKCGIEFETYCSQCKDRECIEKCFKGLAEKSDACDLALHEQADFECGIDIEVDCGKAHRLGPIEFVHCIEKRKPCEGRH